MSLVLSPDPHSVVPPSTTPHTTATVASSAYTSASSAAANHVASLAMGQSAAMNGASSQQLFQPTSSKSVLLCV